RSSAAPDPARCSSLVRWRGSSGGHPFSAPPSPARLPRPVAPPERPPYTVPGGLIPVRGPHDCPPPPDHDPGTRAPEEDRPVTEAPPPRTTRSAAADERDDLDRIARGQGPLPVLGLGDQPAVDLDRAGPARQA